MLPGSKRFAHSFFPMIFDNKQIERSESSVGPTLLRLPMSKRRHPSIEPYAVFFNNMSFFTADRVYHI